MGARPAGGIDFGGNEDAYGKCWAYEPTIDEVAAARVNAMSQEQINRLTRLSRNAGPFKTAIIYSTNGACTIL
jgi:hypothetical protein